jgi:hypothetical protein
MLVAVAAALTPCGTARPAWLLGPRRPSDQRWALMAQLPDPWAVAGSPVDVSAVGISPSILGCRSSPAADPSSMSVLGSGVPVPLACSAYPTPRSGAGAAFRQTGSGQYLATRRPSGPTATLKPSTFRLRDRCSASTWTAPEGSSLLTLDDSSVQKALAETLGGVRVVRALAHFADGHGARSCSAWASSGSPTLLVLRVLHRYPSLQAIRPRDRYRRPSRARGDPCRQQREAAHSGDTGIR